jgi:hypothetical protein
MSMSVRTAVMTIAASTAVGSGSSSEAAGSRARTASPVTAPLHADLAPANRFRALREKDPPTGKPPVNAAATLAAPWETNSRLASQCRRSWPAKLRAMAAGSAKPTRAITAPATSSCGA